MATVKYIYFLHFIFHYKGENTRNPFMQHKPFHCRKIMPKRNYSS